jgi:hypothetical protein
MVIHTKLEFIRQYINDKYQAYTGHMSIYI